MDIIEFFKDCSTRKELRIKYNREGVPEGYTKEALEEDFSDWKKNNSVEPKTSKDINDKDLVLKLLTIGKSLEDLSGEFNVSSRVANAVIDDLKDEGYNIVELYGTYRLMKNIMPTENIHNIDWTGETVIKFGIVSDTHLCNKFQQLTFLNDLYDLFKREGIDTVYHSGDLSDGFNKRRPDHIYELFKIGVDLQADYIIENYPHREGITTKFITGNHDHWHVINGGADIGRMISRQRKDMVYLGCSNATINLTPNCKMELNHPLDGAAYALSYSLQKYMDSLSGGEKPNILVNGHHHKGMYLFYRNIHALEAGTTCAQTPFMKGKRIAAHTGGWIVEVHVDSDGTITRCIPEFIPLYKCLKNDY